MASVRKRKWTYNGEEKSAYVVCYKDRDGKRRMKTFDKKKDADKYRDQVAAELLRGEHVPAAQAVTVKDAVEQYLQHCEDKARDGRIGRAHLYNLQRVLRRSVVQHIGGMSLTDVRSVTVEDLYQALCRTDRLKPETARQRLGLFKLVQDFAFKRGMLRTRPVSDALEDLRGIKKEQIATFTQEEIATLLDAAKKRGFKRQKRMTDALNIFVNLAAFCGLRFGEIAGLTVGCVDFANRMILVRHSLSRLDGLKAPKTAAGVRDVPMPLHVAALLRSWLDTHYLKNRQDLVFTTAVARPLDLSGFHQSLWHPLLKRAGLFNEENPYHFHALRHFAASWMIDSGLPAPDVAALLGHSKVDLTMRVYVHRVTKSTHRHRAAIDGMAAALLDAPRTIDGTALSILAA